jgi:quercetin dioxygenase-like cupin family protein
MRAFRIQNDSLGNSYFEVGTLPEYVSIESERFIIQTKIEAYQKSQHPAPREQYVVTLKGKLRFTTSDGNQFILEPGIILVAKDIHGEGHSWELIEGDDWQRIYIVPNQNSEDAFIAD